MKADVLGRRYAGALIDIGREDGQMERYGTELSQALDLFASKEIWRSFVSPLLPAEAKKRIVKDVARQTEWADATTNLLQLLIDKKRIAILPQVVDAYQELADSAMGRLRAKVESAVPLQDATKESLKQKLAARFGCEIILVPEIDSKVIGGVRATVGSTVIDGTVQGQLARLRHSMKRG